MSYTWINTTHEGIRYREHPIRKHGVKADKYYAIRYRVDVVDPETGEAKRVRKEESLGWESQGWSLDKVRETYVIPFPDQSPLFVGFVGFSSTYRKSTPASPPPRRLEIIFDLKMEVI